MTPTRAGLVLALSGAAALVAVASCGEDDVAPGADAGLDGPAASPVEASGDASIADARSDSSTTLVDTCRDLPPFPGTWVADPHLCVTVYAKSLPVARQFAFAPNGDVFVKAAGKIVVLSDTNRNAVIEDGEAFDFASSIEGHGELNHGVAFDPTYTFLYASNDTTVYRWRYSVGDRAATTSAEIVVSGLPAGGGHQSRSLAFDPQGRLYVNVGSFGDVDQDETLLSERAMIRRFIIPAALPPGAIGYFSGEIYAWGLRNEVGISFDSKGRFWGVENGSDGVDRDNPAEEINRLDAPGPRFFGWPYCWTEFARDGGLGRGTQWAYRGYVVDKGDVWCRDPAKVQMPAGAMQGHWAPLGITEYTGDSLPWRGDLFVTSHGSTYRTPSVGRLIARAHLVGDVIQEITPIVGQRSAEDGGLQEGIWEVRPVDIHAGPDGALYFSDDNSHRIFRIGYRP